MRITYILFVFAIVVMGLVSCNSLKYVIDYDDRVNFDRYETYNFTPAADSIPLNQLNKRRLFNAIVRKFYCSCVNC